MSKQNADPLGLLLTLLLGGILFAFVNSCSNAYGAPCRVCKQQIVAQSYVAPSLAYTPAVQYMIGQSVRQESADVAAFRHSPDWQDYQRLKAWKEGVKYGAALRDQPAADVEPPKWTPTPEQPADDEDLPLPAPLPEEPVGQEPTPADGARFADKTPTLVARCSKCHTGDEPKGDLWLDGSVDLTSADGAEKRDSIVRALLHGHMPPSGQPPVSDAEFGAILYELYPAEEPK